MWSRTCTHYNEQRRRTVLRDPVLTQLLSAVFANTVSLGTGLILLLGAGAMRAGTFSVGDFALFVSYLPFVTDFARARQRPGAIPADQRIVRPSGHAAPGRTVRRAKWPLCRCT